MALSSSISTPDMGQLSAVSSEVAASMLRDQHSHDAYIGSAVSTLASEAKADINSIGAKMWSSRTVTIAYTDFAALAGGVKTKDYDVGAALPAAAILVGPPRLSGLTEFDDATHGTFAVTVGTSAGGTQIGTSESVAAGVSGFPKLMTAGANGFATADAASAQLSARITSSVDLNTATAGAVTITVYYVVPV